MYNGCRDTILMKFLSFTKYNKSQKTISITKQSTPL